jgi:hypothetical protein
MSQINYTTIGGDSLPIVAERCGHAGEWPAILEVNPWLEGLDYMAVPPGSNVLLPDDWMPRGYEGILPEDQPAPSTRSTRSSSKDD